MKAHAARPLSLAETLALTLIAIFALYTLGGGTISPYPNYGYFGWNLKPDLSTVAYVTPHSPAAHAGLRAGDHLDWKTLPLLGRTNLGIVQPVKPGERITFTASRNGVRTSHTVEAVPFGPTIQNTTRLEDLVQLALIAISIVLVRLRPSRMTWGFLLWWFADLYNVAEGDPVRFALAYGTAAILWGTSAGGFLTFVSRYPTGEPRGPLRILDRAAIPAGAVVAALWLTFYGMILFAIVPPQWLFVVLQALFLPAVSVIAIVALVISARLTSGSDRQRVLPVLAAVTLDAVIGGASFVWGVYFTDDATSLILTIASTLTELLVAAAVVYGVLRNRVMDVSFVISRTLVYTILTSLIVGTFALIDFASSKLLEHFQLALLLEACAALGFGIWLNSLHGRVDRFIDSTIFRRRHLAEQRLLRTAHALRHSESTRFVDEALVVEPAGALGLSSAALFRRNGDAFVRVSSQGWEIAHIAAIPLDDTLAVHLSAELEAIDLHEVPWTQSNVPEGLAQPILALPLSDRHDLVAFALYSGHTGGEAVDPDEQRALANLADCATDAYEHIRATNLETEATALRTENAMLAQERKLLREMLDALQAVRQPQDDSAAAG
ncbi:MAG: hypothetical protein JO322_12255 [Candidatus Eremiobacteraeota bacterium]|nr:hypothetical protein [Candidatus Eremiobacteraeota bacterium]